MSGPPVCVWFQLLYTAQWKLKVEQQGVYKEIKMTFPFLLLTKTVLYKYSTHYIRWINKSCMHTYYIHFRLLYTLFINMCNYAIILSYIYLYVIYEMFWFAFTSVISRLALCKKQPCPRQEFSTSDNLKCLQNLKLTIPTEAEV